MYPALPFGPITLPTGPLFAMLAIFFGLESAGRFGRRFGLRTDDVWNVGLLALLAGLIVARSWNVFQFWYVYSAEPLLIFSLRPGGFALWPGVVAALVVGYAYLLRRALDPLRVAAALAMGLLTAAAILAVSDHLTGAITGLPSNLPWARPYFGEMQHPAALYRALGFVLSVVFVWTAADPRRPGRTLGHVGLAGGLVLLVADAFAAPDAMTGPFRTGQLMGLALALLSAGALAFQTKRRDARSMQAAEPGDAVHGSSADPSSSLR
ncbi:MAG: prolipoprotein diacylglyceryl transferase [Caldilinea sp.]|nr:prolipoprotein diacylglyceryl transferase [Caldilinea sp.]MDW8439184.1 prolipoprotein diacylglyceryl transferase [Caldilineaceae bacterium]